MIKCSRCRKWVSDEDILTLSWRPVCITCAEQGAERRMGRRPSYVPTPEEISAECDLILAEDSDERRRKRAGHVAPFTIPSWKY